MRLSDYHVIKVIDETSGKERGLKVQETVKWHSESVDYIRSEIEKAEKNEEQVLVFSHHAPVIHLGSAQACEYHGDIEPAFCTDLTDLMKDSVVAWCYGHTQYVLF